MQALSLLRAESWGIGGNGCQVPGACRDPDSSEQPRQAQPLTCGRPSSGQPLALDLIHPQAHSPRHHALAPCQRRPWGLEGPTLITSFSGPDLPLLPRPTWSCCSKSGPGLVSCSLATSPPLGP